MLGWTEGIAGLVAVGVGVGVGGLLAQSTGAEVVTGTAVSGAVTAAGWIAYLTGFVIPGRDRTIEKKDQQIERLTAVLEKHSEVLQTRLRERDEMLRTLLGAERDKHDQALQGLTVNHSAECQRLRDQCAAEKKELQTLLREMFEKHQRTARKEGTT